MKIPRRQTSRVQPGDPKRFPFPPNKLLSYILDVLYHSSFLTEESRRVALRVTYLPPDLPEQEQKDILNHQGTVTRLLQPRPMTPSELLRLAPAVDPFHSMILVAESKALGLRDGAPLAVWGLLHLGSEWYELVSGLSSSASSPPHSLTVSTFAPGELVVSSGGRVLLRLRDGALLDASPIGIGDGAIGDFLRPTADALYLDVCSKLKRSRFSADESSNEHPRQLYYTTLLNVLLRTRERRHGGSFVIVPDELGISDPRLTDRIAIKYSIDLSPIWEDLVDESVSTREFYDLLFPEYVPTSRRNIVTKKKKTEPQALYWAGERRERVQSRIHDFELFAASLSGVDGAVVLTRRLNIIGFGGEIVATSPSLASVRLASDAAGAGGKTVPITSFGTRHRSAFRFCSSFEDALCFVISQDGQVKGVKRVGPNLIMWNDLTAKEEVM